MPCIRCHVSGRVQGVFFRVSTRNQANTLGLTGEVRNMPDGRVEVIACGSEKALAVLQAWLRAGPPQAVISEVHSEPCQDPGCKQFDIK